MNGLVFVKYVFRVVAAIAAAWAALSLLGLAFGYSSLVPTWAMAIVAGAGCSAIEALYRRERRLVSKRVGRALVAIRCAAFCLVAFMLMQPVIQRTVSRRQERTVAVLIDASASMRFADTNWNAQERISLARALGLAKNDEIPLPSLEGCMSAIEDLRQWLPGSAARKITPAAHKALGNARREASRLIREIGDLNENDATNPVFRSLSRILSSSIMPSLEEYERTGNPFMAENAIADFDAIAAQSIAASSSLLWDALGDTRRKAILDAIQTSRLDLACLILTNSLQALGRRYDVRHYDLGRSLLPLPSPSVTTGSTFQIDATDMASAMEKVITDIPSERLAGILLLSDGIHNGDASVEPVARQLGSRGVKIDTVLVGSSLPPFDLALADISAPESIFLGDKVRVRGVLSATQAAGREAHITLTMDGLTVDETTIPVSDDALRREFSLSHSPTNTGLAHYELAIDAIDGEQFPSNNMWNVDVAVSDDRINVLVIDDYPRWEFRYLRNLFFARDKSVHLQYLLMHPDTIQDSDPTNHPPPASASRPFGEAEAGSLPENSEEWRKFDVIILGDIGPDVLDDGLQSTLAECVRDRGALLVAIAGPRAMPHAFPTNSPLASLLPYDYAPSCDGSVDYWDAPEKSFSITPTPQGRLHPVMQQSTSASENEQIWASLSKCHWRFPTLGARAGTEIIAYAEPANDAGGIADNAGEATTARNALSQIAAERARREKLALIVAQNAGRGKVLALNTDESWRLRYRIGDVRHHRFWGQILRWGQAERLRNGTDRLRIGTDKLTYAPHEPVRVIARVLDEKGAPVKDAKLRTKITHGEQAAIEATLLQIAESHGLYEATIPPLGETGSYLVEILNPENYSGEGADQRVASTFFVAASRRPIEMARVAASRETPETLAKWTGGRVVSPHEAASLATDFGEGSQIIREQKETAIWCDRRLFLAILAFVFAEWILRKKAGLV